MFLHHRAATVQEAAPCTKHSFICFRKALLWVSLSTAQQVVWFFTLIVFLFLRYLREWTFTQPSLTASSRSTTSKATRPSATSSESTPLIHLTLGAVLASKAQNIRVGPLQTQSPVRDSWSTTGWWQTCNLRRRRRRPSRFRAAR